MVGTATPPGFEMTTQCHRPEVNASRHIRPDAPPVKYGASGWCGCSLDSRWMPPIDTLAAIVRTFVPPAGTGPEEPSHGSLQCVRSEVITNGGA